MIIAGTVSAYLKLSIDDFQNNLQAAIQMLGQTTIAIAPVNAGLLGLKMSAGSASGACTVMASTLSSTAQQIKSGVLTPIRSLPAPLTEAMKDAGSGMITGLHSKTAAIIAAARSIATRVVSTIRSALKIASPSKVMRQIGSYAVEGMALGLADGIPRIANRSAAVARTVERASMPELSFYGTAPVPSSASHLFVRDENISGLAALSERMDRLLDYLYDTEPVLRLDGRTFGRMVREYS